MKRIGYLYEQVCSMDNLKLAHKNARKNKTWYKEVKMVDSNPDYYLKILQNSLINHTYKTSKYETFIKKENGKERIIYKLPYFPDRVCQWAILQVIEPMLIKYFTDNTYSAIPKRGTHKCLYKVINAIQHDVPNCQYCLKIDAKKYYPSINHDVLKKLYARLFKDKELLDLIYEIIDSTDDDTGIPIGNYLSQYSGNLYLTPLDHWLKEEKHVKYAFRYMDDIVIFGRTKEELHKLRIEMKNFMQLNLKLKMKDNWQVFPTYIRGVDFVGYRIFLDYVLLRKSTCINFKRKMNSINRKRLKGETLSYSDYCSFNSYKGILKHCNSYKLTQKYIKPLERYVNSYYKFYIKKGGKNMVNHGKVKSTVKPESIEIDENNVWVNSNIKSIKETNDEHEFIGYEYDMVQYEKDEYIKYITQNQNQQITDVQLALVEIYESMGV